VVSFEITQMVFVPPTIFLRLVLGSITDRDNQGEVSITRVSLSKVLIINHEKT
jgi:hypothetical protein